MQSTLVPTSTAATPASEAEAQQTANNYLAATLGEAYFVANGFYARGNWIFLIHKRTSAGLSTIGLGKITVEGATGNVVALTDTQLRQLSDLSLVMAAQERGEIARDECGYVLLPYAMLKASEWLSDNLTLHFSATDGIFVPLERPLWQFAIRFRLPRLDAVKPLGLIDVDARTGEVIPLTNQQLQTIQERVHAITRHHELASVA